MVSSSNNTDGLKFLKLFVVSQQNDQQGGPIVFKK